MDLSGVGKFLSFGKGNTRVYVPLGTSILLSVLLTILLNLFFRR